MKKFLVLLLISFMSIGADHVKRIVTFDVSEFKKTNVACHITGQANFVNFEKKTVKRQYNVTTSKELCPNAKIKYTCHLIEVLRETDDNKTNILEGSGACRPSIAPDPQLLKVFSEQIPESADCTKK